MRRNETIPDTTGHQGEQRFVAATGDKAKPRGERRRRLDEERPHGIK